MIVCNYYDTKFSDTDEESVAKYLVKLNLERVIKFKMSLI